MQEVNEWMKLINIDISFMLLSRSTERTGHIFYFMLDRNQMKRKYFMTRVC